MTTERFMQLQHFLNHYGYGHYQLSLLAGDASFRKYYRIQNEDSCYVVMDAPPEFERLEPFIAIDKYLNRIGLNAPDILAEDLEHGFLLLQDFGDTRLNILFSANDNIDESAVYRTAVDVLIALQKRPLELTLPSYSLEEYLRELQLFTDWYLPYLMPEQDVIAAKQDYIALWTDLIARLQRDNSVMVLRDYHADNLMWPNGRVTIAPEQLGLLDFQDALIGHPAYDLVSLLEDARRDVPQPVQEEMFSYFCDKRNLEPERFKTDYAILGAQRNLKILGIFLRLAKRDHKTAYLEFVPRVWHYLQQDLKHEALLPMQNWMERNNIRLVTREEVECPA